LATSAVGTRWRLRRWPSTRRRSSTTSFHPVGRVGSAIGLRLQDEALSGPAFPAPVGRFVGGDARHRCCPGR
jgi:hypothetical protein